MGDRAEPHYHELRDGDAGGVFGAADVLGCVNRLTPARILDAVELVRTGEVYPLNAPLDWPNPALFGRGTVRHHVLDTERGNHDEYLDDFFPQSSSQWDGLSHIRRSDGTYYNGRQREELGIEHWARRGLVGRGVLLDVARWRAAVGREVDWSARDEIDPNDLASCSTSQGLEIRHGDILLVRTGWTSGYQISTAADREQLQDPHRFAAPGLAPPEEIAELLWNWGISAVAADNPALEPWPFPDESLHERLIPRLGMPIGELWWLDDLATACGEDDRYDFLLVSAPLHLVHGVGSPANALAIR